MPPSSGRRPTRASGRPKVALLGRHDDVAAEHHLEPAADRMAVDARDHRHVERLAQRDAAEAARPSQRPVFEPARAAAALHVGAGREGALARAGQHDAAHVAIALDLAPDLLQFALGRRIDGVEHLRPVDGDAGDVIRDLEQDRHHSAAVARACASSASTSCGVLAEFRGRNADRDRRVRHVDRRADDLARSRPRPALP